MGIDRQRIRLAVDEAGLRTNTKDSEGNAQSKMVFGVKSRPIYRTRREVGTWGVFGGFQIFL